VQTRAMIDADIEAGLRLCRASGWNQLEADWRCFLETGPRGCRVAVCEDRVVGTVATLNYEGRFGWISMLLVDPQWRGRGIGTRLLEDARHILSDVPTARLDATPAGKLVYDKAGFQDEYPLVRMRAAAPATDAHRAVRAVEDADWTRLLAWDRLVFGADRGAILHRLHRSAPEYAFVAEGGSEIRGYLFGRHGFLAEHLGPLVALDAATARALVSACIEPSKQRPFLIDAPRHTVEWNRWLESCGFREERPFIRMFHGPNLYPGRPGQVFAIAGPELG